MATHLSQTPKWLRGCFYILGLASLGFGGLFIWLGVQDGSSILTIIGVLWILINAPFPVYFLLVRRARARVGMPEVSVDKQTLRVGETLNVEYNHRFERAARITRIVAQLVLRERATFETYDHQTNRRTTRTTLHDNVVQEVTAQAGQFLPGQAFQHRFTLRIPPDGIHSFSVHHNQLQWLVRIKIVLPWLPDLIVTRPLKVLPELAEEV